MNKETLILFSIMYFAVLIMYIYSPKPTTIHT
uniref:Uncharacterized protein n=1 Tax=viral metagenome TaxID=1070528 RepID=A0A6C0HWX4_9ZZZZ